CRIHNARRFHAIAPRPHPGGRRILPLEKLAFRGRRSGRTPDRQSARERDAIIIKARYRKLTQQCYPPTGSSTCKAAYSSMIATARVQPADAARIFTGKQDTVNPVEGSASRLCSFSIWQ